MSDAGGASMAYKWTLARDHEVEVQQVMNPQRLQHQHHGVHVRPLYFRDRILLELMRKGPLRVQPKAGPRLGPTSSPSSLSSLRLTNWSDDQRLDARSRIVGLLLAETRVNHIADPVDGQRRLSYICTDHDLPRVFRRGLEDLGLLLARQGGVDGADEEFFDPCTQCFSSLQ